MLGLLKRKRQADAPARAPAAVPPGLRVYAVGDVHGRDDLLEEAFGLIAADSAARGPAEVHLVMLGDLVDRGEQSREVVERLTRLPDFADELHVIRGNHEAVFLSVLDDASEAQNGWMRFGGRETLESYGIRSGGAGSPRVLAAELASRVPAHHVRLLRETLPHVQIGDYLFVHAGIRPGVPLERQNERDLMWIRESFLDDPRDHGMMVVHGHSITESVDSRANRIGIDTGAFATGRLTVLGLEGEQRWLLSTGGEGLDSEAFSAD